MAPGGYSAEQAVTEEVAGLVKGAQKSCEDKCGKAFETFQPTTFVQQVVAGMNYKVKVKVDGEACIHVTLFCPLPHTGEDPQVVHVEADKTDSDALA
mmetsp:Transcript_1628/g.3589  ORF Transcript_1628/g.3589 Transcript_1628/m.3589 type:complete len:97 (+) Transcript_1628:40-330(+)